MIQRCNACGDACHILLRSCVLFNQLVDEVLDVSVERPKLLALLDSAYIKTAPRCKVIRRYIKAMVYKKYLYEIT